MVNAARDTQEKTSVTSDTAEAEPRDKTLPQRQRRLGRLSIWGRPKQIQSKTMKGVVVVVGRESDGASYCLRGINIGSDRGAKLVSTNRTHPYESETQGTTSERD